jgi:hypothetical protein
LQTFGWPIQALFWLEWGINQVAHIRHLLANVGTQPNLYGYMRFNMRGNGIVSRT